MMEPNWGDVWWKRNSTHAGERCREPLCKSVLLESNMGLEERSERGIGQQGPDHKKPCTVRFSPLHQ